MAAITPLTGWPGSMFMAGSPRATSITATATGSTPDRQSAGLQDQVAEPREPADAAQLEGPSTRLLLIASRRKWQVYIGANRKRIFVGLFDSRDAAERAYRDAAAELHGQFSFTERQIAEPELRRAACRLHGEFVRLH